MTSGEIREKFLNFWQERGHTRIPSASLVPENDPTTLFTSSGMQPLIPYLLGEEHPGGPRLVDAQKCFRAEDVDEVGDNRHTTFFEMLGNWSLGDYFKSEQLSWVFELLTKVVGIDPAKLYVTVFAGDEARGIPRDDESVQIWKGVFKQAGIEAKDIELVTSERAAKEGMGDGRIFYYDAGKNWWSRSGVPENMPVGEPGGPDSEIFYDFGTPHNPEYGKHCHPNCDCGRFLEIGNSVFMEYQKAPDGSFAKLAQQNVDFGGGLERITAAAANNPDIFQIDSFQPVIALLMGKSKQEYLGTAMRSMRVITDHTRAAAFLLADGVLPSNVEKGYVLRKLIRRAVRHGKQLGFETNFMREVGAAVIKLMDAAYDDLVGSKEQILAELDREESRFRQTLNKGLKELEKLIAGKNEIDGSDIFVMSDTYGMPPELTLEELAEKRMKVTINWREQFDAKLEQQKAKSRTATAGMFKGGLADHSEITTWYHTAAHLTYAALRQVLGDHVHQRGSNINAERMRFDFSHPEKMTDEQKRAVEDYVNAAIAAGASVSYEELPTDQAFASGAIGEFGHKYGDVVKVYTVKDASGKIWSREICGGPHVTNTADIKGKYKISKEESVAAGIRRVKAVVTPA